MRALIALALSLALIVNVKCRRLKLIQFFLDENFTVTARYQLIWNLCKCSSIRDVQVQGSLIFFLHVWAVDARLAISRMQ